MLQQRCCAVPAPRVGGRGRAAAPGAPFGPCTPPIRLKRPLLPLQGRAARRSLAVAAQRGFGGGGSGGAKRHARSKLKHDHGGGASTAL
jgi:hypothetical protein